MRQPLVAGNWKMHGSRAENAKLIEGLAERFPPTAVACAVCPPHVYLSEVGRMLHAAELPIELGAQDVSAEPKGAFTGEVSVTMLRDMGCRYVIVGHSERRQAEGEDDHLVARKFEAARTQMVPILCVGERLGNVARRADPGGDRATARCGAGALRGHRLWRGGDRL